MSELEIIGLAANRGTPEGPPSREHPDFKTLNSKHRLTLREASSLANIAIQQLKLAIQEGKLLARWEGKYIIERCELDHFMRD